jgi:large subunit ribosomal protein L23
MSQERLMTVLLGPHVSEKGTALAEKNNQVVFRVHPDADKAEIRKAVELMFEVKVEGVQVVNVHGKNKRFGRMQGKRANWKKAYAE